MGPETIMRGPRHTVSGDFVAGVEDGVECRAHVADAGDAVGEEERRGRRSVPSAAVESK